MDTWYFEKRGWDSQSAVADGNRFLIANGYMGLRGTVEEAARLHCPAVNLAGVYDRFADRWREPVNPWPWVRRSRYPTPSGSTTAAAFSAVIRTSAPLCSKASASCLWRRSTCSLRA